ncbi:MAG TPA: TonB-dependent receptor, partial [Pedobacter sp.]
MKPIFTKLLFLILLPALTPDFKLSAQTLTGTGKIKGKVMDEQKKPASYATISLLRATDSTLVKKTLTTTDGDFIFEELLSGAYLISVEWIGYKRSVSNVLKINQAQQVNTAEAIILFPDPQQLNTVNVIRKKPAVETKNGKVILNVASSIIASGNTAMEILSKAPGVTVDREGHISLRGRNGVNVMINGKLTYLSSEQLAVLLRSTDGNTIETIELMSNPPSKYDASGSAGLINIRLKKSSSYGTNGSLTAGAGYGKFYKTNGGITLNHRTKYLNIFGNYNYVNAKDYQDLDLRRSSTSGDETTFFDQQGRDITLMKNNSYRAGMDYYINDKNTLGFLFNGYTNNNTTNNSNKTLIGHQLSGIDSSIVAANPGKSQYSNQSYNLNYKSVLDTSGQEFSADADYSRFQSNNQIVYNNYFYDNAGVSFKDPLIYRNASPSTVKIWSGKIDYTYPFNAKMKLETGIKSSYVHTDNDFQFENLQSDNWENDISRSNRFIYKEYVNAAYANLSKEFKNTSVQVGLRTEITSSEGNSPTTQNVVKRNYTDLFPNLSVSQKLSDQHDLGFSYNRRIDRPDYQSLNPFLYFNDLYTYSQGNPLLNPQYTNSFELTYGYKKTFNATLGYSRTKDVITTTLITDTVSKTILIKEQNLADQHTFNLNMSMPFTIIKWWNTTNNATLYYTSFNSPDLMGARFHSGKTSYLLNTTQSLTISPS